MADISPLLASLSGLYSKETLNSSDIQELKDLCNQYDPRFNQILADSSRNGEL
jgi:hypothetical protein